MNLGGNQSLTHSRLKECAREITPAALQTVNVKGEY